MLLSALIDWSRLQFAMSAMYHWIFVPLTLGMGFIMALAETKYYRTGDDFWKETAKFWQKIFGINFAAGIATGLILEFQFGTNWSNYSYFVGDIFGAPLAIEGMFAFFMEATFFAVMFFGWDKVSKKFHLASTWLTIGGATLSATLGLVSAILTIATGHLSAGHVATYQPMKLAAMENMYEGSEKAPLSVIGIVNSDKKKADWASDKSDYAFNIALPSGLSILSFNDPNAYVPGIKNILEGGYTKPDGTIALSAEERIQRGKIAIQALADYRAAKEAGNEAEAAAQKEILDANYEHFGYGYFDNVEDLIPNIPMLYYSFRIMVGLGMLFILVCLVPLIMLRRNKEKFVNMRWYHWVMIISIPLVYIASQAGWVVAEVGRQPWTIQDALPVQAAVSNIAASAVKTTFTLFLVLFTLMLIAELSIMIHAIKKGPKNHVSNDSQNEAK